MNFYSHIIDYASIQQEFPADGYFIWIPNRPEIHRILSVAVFGYCLALHVFIAGFRRNNSDAINVAKVRFTPVFFGLRMQFNVETFFRDSVLLTKCPPILLNFLKNHEYPTIFQRTIAKRAGILCFKVSIERSSGCCHRAYHMSKAG